MARPRRLIGLTVLIAGVGGGFAVGFFARASPPTRTIRTTTARVEVINGNRSAKAKPAPLPTLVEGSRDPRGLVLSDAVPADANLVSASYVTRSPRQLTVTWRRAYVRGGAAIWQRNGVAIWQLDRGNAAAWHRVYTREEPVNNTIGIEGFVVTLGDATGDGRPEVLVFADTDGSAGGGTYYLLANVGDRMRPVFVENLSADDGEITFGHRALVVLEGRDHVAGQGVHCCYRKVRETWLRWNGQRMVTVRQFVRANRRGWPPG